MTCTSNRSQASLPRGDSQSTQARADPRATDINEAGMAAVTGGAADPLLVLPRRALSQVSTILARPPVQKPFSSQKPSRFGLFRSLSCPARHKTPFNSGFKMACHGEDCRKEERHRSSAPLLAFQRRALSLTTSSWGSGHVHPC